ncbi:MAG: hypothetical protein Q9157_002837 [Trypethelium eluteriae]
MPILAPGLSPELVLPLEDVLALLLPPVLTAEEIVEGAMVTDEVTVLPLDVKAEIEVLPETVETAFVEVGPDVGELELRALEELPDALVLAESELPDGAADPDARTDEGIWPSRNWILCPVLCGSEHMFARLAESLNAIVADDATVQLQYAPGWRVEGFPFCEQIAHSPLLLSHNVRATHGWAKRGQSILSIRLGLASIRSPTTFFGQVMSA